MKNMENVTRQLNTSAWHRRRADKLSAAARQPSKIGGGAYDLAVHVAAAVQRDLRTTLKRCTCLLFSMHTLHYDKEPHLKFTHKVNRQSII